jgi:transcriptional regulator with GAF, ATPase, and Fis domain
MERKLIIQNLMERNFKWVEEEAKLLEHKKRHTLLKKLRRYTLTGAVTRLDQLVAYMEKL